MLRRIVRGTGDKKVQLQDLIKQVDAFPKVSYYQDLMKILWKSNFSCFYRLLLVPPKNVFPAEVIAGQRSALKYM